MMLKSLFFRGLAGKKVFGLGYVATGTTRFTRFTSDLSAINAQESNILSERLPSLNNTSSKNGENISKAEAETEPRKSDEDSQRTPKKYRKFGAKSSDNTKKFKSNKGDKQNFKATLNDLEGIIHATCTFNNTHVVVTNMLGDVKYSLSGGMLKKMGNLKKGDPYTALRLGEEVAKKAMTDFNIKIVELKLKGAGKGRSGIFKGLQSGGMQILRVGEKNCLPHNGCRPKKQRRI